MELSRGFPSTKNCYAYACTYYLNAFDSGVVCIHPISMRRCCVCFPIWFVMSIALVINLKLHIPVGIRQRSAPSCHMPNGRHFELNASAQHSTQSMLTALFNPRCLGLLGLLTDHLATSLRPTSTLPRSPSSSHSLSTPPANETPLPPMPTWRMNLKEIGIRVHWHSLNLGFGDHDGRNLYKSVCM